jgi:hypothetical protein
MKKRDPVRVSLAELFGGGERKRERDSRRGNARFFEHLFRDLRYAIRQLRRSPGFGITAIAVLSFGIGSCVAIFGFVEAALIKPLPYREPARLVGVYERVTLRG